MEDLVIYADKWIAAVLVGCALLIVYFAIVRQLQRTPSTSQLMLLGLLVLISIILPMFGLWMGGRTLPNALGGLLPWNDAAGYFNCARALADGAVLDSFCQRRPHYTAYLTSLLTAAGGNLQLMLLIQALILASATFLFAKTISARWGLASAVVAIAPIAAFAGIHSVTTLTENLGLVFGVVALLFLLNASHTRHSGTLSLGIFLLTLGLSARAGAFFVLPLLLLWPLLLSDSSMRERARLAGFILFAIIAGLAVGPIISFLLGGAPSSTHANFSYTIFGVVSGGKGWLHIFNVHPEFFGHNLSKSQIAREVYAATWQVFFENPLLAVEGLTKGLLIYIERILKYIPWLPARIFIVLCWLTGIIHILRHRREPTNLLLGLIALGIATSAPIIAFDAGTRVYAATIAADATIVALGFFTLANAISHRVGQSHKETGAVTALSPTKNRGAVNVIFSLALILAVTLAPIAIAITSTQNRHAWAPSHTCATGTNMSVARLGNGSPVLPITSDGHRKIWPVSPTANDFSNHIDKYTAKASGLREATPGTTYLYIYDLAPEPVWKTYLGIAVDMIVPMDGHVYVICSKTWPTAPVEDARKITSISTIDR